MTRVSIRFAALLTSKLWSECYSPHLNLSTCPCLSVLPVCHLSYLSAMHPPCQPPRGSKVVRECGQRDAVIASHKHSLVAVALVIIQQFAHYSHNNATIRIQYIFASVLCLEFRIHSSSNLECWPAPAQCDSELDLPHKSASMTLLLLNPPSSSSSVLRMIQ